MSYFQTLRVWPVTSSSVVTGSFSLDSPKSNLRRTERRSGLSTADIQILDEVLVCSFESGIAGNCIRQQVDQRQPYTNAFSGNT
jgi:hypothetical protein